MRKSMLLLLLSISFTFAASAQFITIPNSNFRNFLIQRYPACFNASGMMDTTCTAILNETSLTVTTSVTDWQGFQYFRNLQQFTINSYCPVLPAFPAGLLSLKLITGSPVASLPALPPGLKFLTITGCTNIITLPALPSTLIRLDCTSNSNLTSLPALPAALTYLKCYGNKLASLPALPPLLDTLNCQNNDSIAVLPALPAGLKALNCAENRITSLGTLPTSLLNLTCHNNLLTQLPALPSGLRWLEVSSNQITSLPTLPDSLRTLSVNANQLTSIPTLPSRLDGMVLNGNNITSLPPLPGTLTYLDARVCQLTSLPALPATLQRLYVDDNHLTSLPAFPAPLYEIWCDNNQLTSLPALPAALKYLKCSNNQLTSLPTLPSLLNYLMCEHNQLMSLPVIPNTVSQLYIQDNNIACLPAFTLHPGGIDIQMDDDIHCIPNFFRYSIELFDNVGANVGSFNYDNAPYPICNAVNNDQHCTGFPEMKGFVFNDNNNNGIKDADEPFRANVRVSLSNGTFTTTNGNGFYALFADSIGTYTVDCTAPNFYSVSPASYTYSFSVYDTVVNNNFALQVASPADSLSITVTPITEFTRLGSEIIYDIRYVNAGTTTLTPTVNFNYDNTRLTYVSSTNGSVVNNGNSLRLTESNMVAGEQRYFRASFIVNISSALGDTIFVNANICAEGATATDCAASVIIGAYDPNDKAATPIMTPAQLADGKYIMYTIRFQNTGNDTAFNVVLTDTLSHLLDVSSFDMLASSHLCNTTVEGNNLLFEFSNILLPDSNRNEQQSHGFVRFRMRPQSNVAVDTDIPNTAAIYFDYNQPVITNTAITQIRNQPVAPLKLLSFNAEEMTANRANITWTTANESGVGDFIIEMSNDGISFTSKAAVQWKGDMYNSYIKQTNMPEAGAVYFRLKITYADGNSFYGPVVKLRENGSATQAFSIRENPVKNMLTITLKDADLKNTLARIVNSQGSVVQQIIIKNNVENIDVRRLSAGTYVIQTTKGSSRFVIAR